MTRTRLSQTPFTFTKRKRQILSEIANYDSETYVDKSPKGTVDAEIIDLINEINAFDGYVTTSSCAGRVAVFVEGRKAAPPAVKRHAAVDGDDEEDEVDRTVSADGRGGGAGPGGKGYGNKWLYVSHSVVEQRHLGLNGDESLHGLFQLKSQVQAEALSAGAENVRMIKLSFSPLILHVLCADLHVAKPLLAAAINAGFRESGVQSLKALDEPEAGVMVAIRTAGLTFESVIGVVEEGDGGDETYRSCVDEKFLRICVGAINERFEWNTNRRERLRDELRRFKTCGSEQEWEDKDARRERKRQEGLKHHQDKTLVNKAVQQEDDALDNGLFIEEG